MQLNVLCLSVKNWASCRMNIAHVIAVYEDWIFDGDVQILENPLDPYYFTCGHYRALVFNLNVQQCECWLLLTALGYGFTIEGEDQSKG